ncbi:MAG TPA: hypothetical protein VJA47_04980 [archaeon]|nr:hypothetical protein [archaeon]
MLNTIYIHLNGKEGPLEILALEVDTHSYGWTGPADFATGKYFRVVGFARGVPELKALETEAARKLESNFGEKKEVPKTILRIQEQELSKYLL